MPPIATSIPTAGIAVERAASGESGSARAAFLTSLVLVSRPLGASMYALRKLKKTDHFLKKRDFL